MTLRDDPTPPPRSYLFAPGHDRKLLAKVFDAGADAVVLDLEDAVPRGEKEAARRRTARALRQRPPAQASPPEQAWVRINALGGPFWREDVAAVVCGALAGLRVPKAEDPELLRLLDRKLLQAESAAGLEEGRVPIVATLESARGVLAAETLAQAPRVVGFAFGSADFVADLGAAPEHAPATLYARSRTVVVSRALGLRAPIAGAYTRLNDPEGLRVSTREARNLGFFGRSCIHPKQLPTVHRIFDPSPEEVAWARQTLRAFETAEAQGAGVTVAQDGAFVDAAVVRRARIFLERQEGTAGPGRTAEGRDGEA